MIDGTTPKKIEIIYDIKKINNVRIMYLAKYQSWGLSFQMDASVTFIM
jgi:hypothetical protein